MTPVPRVALVIPCYDEAERLDVDALRSARLPGLDLELVLVNDGSRDDTLARLEELAKSAPGSIRVLDLQPNRGKAEAVRRGVLAALEREPDYVGYWDADLATPLSALPEFSALLEARPDVQAVFGARVQLRGREIERRAWRHYLGRAFATAVAQILGLPIYDTQCGAKLFRAGPLLHDVFADPFETRWIFDVEIVARYLLLRDRHGLDAERFLYELPLREWRDVGDSKVGVRGYLESALSLWRLVRRYGFRPAARRAGT